MYVVFSESHLATSPRIPNLEFLLAGTASLAFRFKLRLFAIAIWPIFTMQALADGICDQSDGTDVTIVLKDSDAVQKLSLKINQAYFDQRFIPQSGSEKRALGLRLNAMNFAPWPKEIRPHQSEGPYLRFLMASFLPFELIAQRFATFNLGYKFTDEIVWQERSGPNGLLTFVGPPLTNPRKGFVSSRKDIYFARNDQGKMSDIIVCKRPGKTPFVSCEHFIEQGDVDIKLGYAPDFLPEWRRLSDDAKSFFDCIKE